MTLTELVANLGECHKELEKMGAFGGFLFDYRGKLSVQMRNEDLPQGVAKYELPKQIDGIIKTVVIGDVAFFSLLTDEEALKEGVTDMFGVLN